MALIKCKECDNQISDTAKSCPQCGAKLSGITGCGTMILVGIVIFVLFAIIAANVPSYDNSVDKAKADLANSITQQCASEAGIPANDPQHKITHDEMSRLSACVDRNISK